MFVLGLIGPEFLLIGCMGQYTKALESFDLFRKGGRKDWTMKHSFLADMSGVHLQVEGMQSFPVTGKGLYFLVNRGYLPYPKISEEAIDDKNKSDGLSRIITALQISWFTLSTLSRPFKSYAMTTLELTTLGYILCALGTIFFWRHKPMDISHPIVLDCPTPLSLIRDDRGRCAATEPYVYTPLDFVVREEWIVTKLWTYYINWLRRMHLVHSFPAAKPARHVNTFHAPPVSGWNLIFITAITWAYMGVFVAGWNFHFPTETERMLWRVAALASLVITVVGGGFEVATLSWYKWKKSTLVTLHHRDTGEMELGQVGSALRARLPVRVQKSLQWLRNNTPDNDPVMDIPIRSLLVTTPLGALYMLCRLVILAEDFATLRELPASVFMAIDWSMYFPHL